jgi:dephospho-CoA kinase
LCPQMGAVRVCSSRPERSALPDARRGGRTLLAMLRIGLTGGIASGKSMVADELAARGAVIIDADALARAVVEPGTPGLAAVVERFGAEVVVDGRLDRRALGRIIFTDARARADLEHIIHPAVRRRAAELEAQAGPDAVVVHVIPLLVETGQADDFDLCVVVDVDPETQLARLADRDGFDAAEAQSRIAAQATREARLGVADVVLDNRGTVDDLRKQAATLWLNLTRGDARK